MKVYAFYLPYKKYKFDEFDSIDSLFPIKTSGDRLSYLYAWTEDKKIANEFKKKRNMDLFKMKKLVIPKEKEVDFRSLYSDAKLRHYSFSDRDSDVQVLVPPFEDRISLYGIPIVIDEILVEKGLFVDPQKIPIFKSKFQDAINDLELDSIGDIIDDCDPELDEDIYADLFVSWNRFHILLYIFGELFK